MLNGTQVSFIYVNENLTASTNNFFQYWKGESTVHTAHDDTHMMNIHTFCKVIFLNVNKSLIQGKN